MALSQEVRDCRFLPSRVPCGSAQTGSFPDPSPGSFLLSDGFFLTISCPETCGAEVECGEHGLEVSYFLMDSDCFYGTGEERLCVQ